jgi:hypothetical protein
LLCSTPEGTRVAGHDAWVETTFARVASHDAWVETSSVEGEGDSLHGEDDPRAAYGLPTDGDAITCTGSVLP